MKSLVWVALSRRGLDNRIRQANSQIGKCHGSNAFIVRDIAPVGKARLVLGAPIYRVVGIRPGRGRNGDQAEVIDLREDTSPCSI